MIENGDMLMRKRRYPIPADKLRKLTHLRDKCQNLTRCLSRSTILEGYQQIKQQISDMDVEEVSDLTPSLREHRHIKK